LELAKGTIWIWTTVLGIGGLEMDGTTVEDSKIRKDGDFSRTLTSLEIMILLKAELKYLKPLT
jgi:hypothetical protein